MNFWENINEQFEIYDEWEEDMLEINAKSENMSELEQFASFPLPLDYKQYLQHSPISAFVLKEKNAAILDFWNILDVLSQQDNYPFLEDELNGKILVVGTDLGDSFYFLGEGQDGFGFYLVDAGSGDYYDEAVKIADSIEDYISQGIGIEVVKKEL